MNYGAYMNGNLYSLRYGAYSVVVAAGDSGEACTAFQAFLRERGIAVNVVYNVNVRGRKTKYVGERHLIIATP